MPTDIQALRRVAPLDKSRLREAITAGRPYPQDIGAPQDVVLALLDEIDLLEGHLANNEAKRDRLARRVDDFSLVHLRKQATEEPDGTVPVWSSTLRALLDDRDRLARRVEAATQLTIVAKSIVAACIIDHDELRDALAAFDTERGEG